MTKRTIEVNEAIAAAYGISEGIIHAAISTENASGCEPTTREIMGLMGGLMGENQVRHALRKMEAGGAVTSKRPKASELDRSKTYRAVAVNG